MMVRLCKDWLNWMIKNDEDATKRSMAKEYLNLMDELEQANARIDALVRDKDELAGRLMEYDTMLERLEWVYDQQRNRMVCPVCGAIKAWQPHIKNCELAALLGKVREKHEVDR
jgi:rubrerythrin